MDKKIMAILIGLLTIGIVSAGIITYYGKITQNVGVEQAVILDCGSNADCTEDVVLDGTSTVTSGVYSLESNREADVIVELVTIVTNSDNVIESGITTRYIGTLELTTKDTTTWLVDGTKATVKYVLVGNNIQAEVTSGAIPGYELIYYKDDKDAQTVGERTAKPQKAIQIAVISGNLPYSIDGNVQEDANYCQAPDNYDHCKGAKIWYVPSTALSNCIDGVCDIVWGQWGSFLYETDLIRFFKNSYGEIVIPAGETLDFQVETTFSDSNVGDYTITTEAQVQ